MSCLLAVNNLSKCYSQKTWWGKTTNKQALAPVSFNLRAFETLAIVGDIGSGKSTLAKLLVGAETPTTGEIYLSGEKLAADNIKQRCCHIRMIFQELGSTLNPNLTIEQILSEPLLLNTSLNEVERKRLIAETLKKVGLLPDHKQFYPHMLSGGQKQRISLARAIILQPQVIILDEALASLDPSLRAQMINVLLDLQQNMGLAYILISHNIGIVRHLSDSILVLEQGQLVEAGPTQQVLSKPQHKCTKKLIINQEYNIQRSHQKMVCP